jgi:hypothetical protein
MTLNIPRDRNSSFEPRLIPKHQRMSDKIEETIIGLYARGMTTSDIAEQIKDLYGVEVSTSTVSKHIGTGKSVANTPFGIHIFSGLDGRHQFQGTTQRKDCQQNDLPDYRA